MRSRVFYESLDCPPCITNVYSTGPYFEAGAVDIVQPDVSHAGGISECKRIAQMAECYDM